MTSIRFLLLPLLFCLSFACNQVKEVQEPDPLSVPQDFPVLSLQFAGDSAEINVLVPNRIDFPVSLDFEKPANGIILKKSGESRFFYRANPGFCGEDTVKYRICNSAACRPGKILIQILPDPSACYPVYQKTDTAEFHLVAGPGLKTLPLFPGDIYCPANTRAFTSFSSFVQSPSISDSVRFNNPFSRTQKKTLFISYANSDQRLGRKIRNLKINLVPDSDYCDAFFAVENCENIVNLNRYDTLFIRKSSLGTFVSVCDGDLDPDFCQVEVSPNLSIRSAAGGIYKVFSKTMGFHGPAKLIYRFRNLRGITDQGEMRIFINEKRGI